MWNRWKSSTNEWFSLIFHCHVWILYQVPLWIDATWWNNIEHIFFVWLLVVKDPKNIQTLSCWMENEKQSIWINYSIIVIHQPGRRHFGDNSPTTAIVSGEVVYPEQCFFVGRPPFWDTLQNPSGISISALWSIISASREIVRAASLMLWLNPFGWDNGGWSIFACGMCGWWGFSTAAGLCYK